jgi:hypothetical protein
MPEDELGQAGLAGDLEHLVKPRPSKIAIDEQDTHPVLRERNREIRRGRRFSFAG